MFKMYSLSNFLSHHEESIKLKILGISDIGELTDNFLRKLVADSLVSEIELKLDKKGRRMRTEYFHRDEMPSEMKILGNFYDYKKYPRTVATIHVPFVGERKLFNCCPNTFGLNFPMGWVSGASIEFDVVIWGKEEDAIKEIDNNIKKIMEFSDRINQQVKEFNLKFPEIVQEIFKSKLDKLTKENNALDKLGILEITEEKMDREVKRTKREPKTIIQIIQKMYVEKFIQKNKNEGNVITIILDNKNEKESWWDNINLWYVTIRKWWFF